MAEAAEWSQESFLLAPHKPTNEVPRTCDLDADARSGRREIGFEIEIARHTASAFSDR
jgi:hypothetical protein